MLSRIFKRKQSKKDKQVTLVVRDGRVGEESHLQVDRAALMEHSAIFREEGRLKKKGSKILLEDMTPVALHKIAEYIQTSSVTFHNHSEAVETLVAAEKYRIDSMSKICVNNLVTVLSSDNVCDVYAAAVSTSQPLLEYHCLRLIDKEAEVVLCSRGFTSLQKASALAIVKRTSLEVASEMTVFRAVLGWGLNACLRQGGDPDDTERFLPLVKYLLKYVRFQTMTEVEMMDPEVVKYHTLVTVSVDHGPFQACNPVLNKNRSLSTSSYSSSTSVPEPQPRRFVSAYSHRFDLLESSHQQVKTGESFTVAFEVLKGRVFLTGVQLAMKPFAATKRAACLYVAVTVVNSSTQEQATTRGTFTSSKEEDEASSLRFSEPLMARENESVLMSLSVKRAENVCLFVMSSDVQIAMPESKTVAIKVSPSSSGADGTERCILKAFEYFF